MSSSLELYRFFMEAFDASGLRRFVLLNYPEMAGELSGRGMAAADLARMVCELLQRRGAVDDGLFAALLEERPRLAGRIEELRRGVVTATGTTKRRLDVMFVAANPRALDELELADEARRIEDSLRGTPGERRIGVRCCWRADADSLMGALFDGVPDVLHFAGHGGVNGAMLLQAVGGAVHPVAPDALAALLGARPKRPRVIVLNACHSVVMARVLLPLVDAVIGMRAAVDDGAARRFAVEFYKGVGHEYPVQVAFDLAVAALRVCNLPGGDMPQLNFRGGVDARVYGLI